jgi:hypothetical protein
LEDTGLIGSAAADGPQIMAAVDATAASTGARRIGAVDIRRVYAARRGPDYASELYRCI